MPKINDRIRREDRQMIAANNAKARAKRTTEEQLALLDKRPGESKRERARLTNPNQPGSKATRRRKRRKPTTS